MTGRRCYCPPNTDPLPCIPNPGDYLLDDEGRLWFRDPVHGAYCHLSPTIHSIKVEPDHTITVAPSILRYKMSDLPEWHGYLERGVWRTV